MNRVYRNAGQKVVIKREKQVEDVRFQTVVYPLWADTDGSVQYYLLLPLDIVLSLKKPPDKFGWIRWAVPDDQEVYHLEW